MKILIKGKDLLCMGFSPGSIFKEIFDRLLEARLNGLIKTKEEEIRFTEETFGKQKPNINNRQSKGVFKQ
jgi:tRNA nucleotidyltransferase (CCA-adding enzyme)